MEKTSKTTSETPTVSKKEFDSSMKEYADLLADTKNLEKKQASLSDEIAQLTAQKESLAATMEETSDAAAKVREQLLNEEQRLNEARQQKAEENENEQRILEIKRREHTDEEARLQAKEEALSKRQSIAEGLERAVRAIEVKNAIDRQSIDKLVGELDVQSASVEAREEAVTGEARRLAALAADLEMREKAVTTKGNEISSREEDIRRTVQQTRAETDAARIQLHEVHQKEMNIEAKLKELKAFCDVASEAREYICKNMKNPDQIENFVSTRFPVLPETPNV